MRSLGIVGALLCAAVSSAEAQRSRLMIVPSFTYSTYSPLYEHTIVESTPSGQLRSVERLAIQGAEGIGVFAAYRLGRFWLVYGDVRHGKTVYDYRSRSEAGELHDEFTESSSATVAAVEFGFGRTVRPFARGPEVDVALGGALHRVRVDNGELDCGPPSTGLPPCARDPWEDRYNIPALCGSVSVDQRIVSRVGIRAGASYSIGRTNTENFWSDLRPEFDHLEAPKSHGVRILEWSLGVSIGI